MAPIRAFIALDMPPEALRALGAWQREALAGRDDLRPIRPEALHLTLAFLGNLDPAEVERARTVLSGRAQEAGPVPIRLDPQPVGVPRRQPRVVAFGAVSEAAVALQAGIASDLVTAGLLKPEGRPFWPHLSIARVRGDPGRKRGRRRSPKASIEALPPLSEGGGHTFGSVRVALYRSELGSQGARYSALAGFDLPQMAAEEET